MKLGVPYESDTRTREILQKAVPGTGSRTLSSA